MVKHDASELNVTVGEVVAACQPQAIATRSEKTKLAKQALHDMERKLEQVPVDKQAVYVELQRLSRGPFRDILAEFLSCAPSANDIRHAAMKSPDRWAQAVAIIAKLSGYHERLEVEGVARVTQMSDAELEAKVMELLNERTKTINSEAKSETNAQS